MQAVAGLISSTGQPAQAHRAALAGLVVAVTATHFFLVQQLPLPRLGEGAGERAVDRAPLRFQVSMRRELAQAAGPLRAAGTAQPSSRTARAPRTPRAPATPSTVAAPVVEGAATVEAAAVAAAASAPASAPAPAVAMLAVPEVPTPAATPAVQPSEGSAAVASAGASAPASPTAAAFEWPPSTRLTYRLSGYYRGPVEGRAQVEWLRSGARYQVHMAVSVGPSFAPLVSRRITSEGDITEQGLRPTRYVEENKVALRDPRRLAIVFDADNVRLPSGQSLPRPNGVQDSASQFVQLTWLFIQDPAVLQTGRSIELPLALPSKVQTWTYDVLQPETLDTPAGPVATMHVKPRRPAGPAGGGGGDLAAEIWVAPSLQYLPVRIVIRQDAENFIDLLLDRLPQQADSGR